jgi:predicted transposase/invertase (TIGR01784 family)
VFSTLFGDRDVLRELYSAIEGIEIPKDMPIDINTLSNIFVKGQINDLSFTIDNRLVVLIEHQSSINNNMPLRLLLYVTKVYQRITNRKSLFQQKLVKIPTPEFIVLYNGETPFPDYQKMRLSDAFIDVAGLKLPKENGLSLELEVHVYNINYGRNPDMLKKSAILNGYSIFVNKIREYNQKLSLEESVKFAVKYCRENNILKEFLDKYGKEVIKMILEDVTVEDEIEARYEEGVEDGIEKTARNALAEGASIEFVQKITGLSREEIEKL